MLDQSPLPTYSKAAWDRTRNSVAVRAAGFLIAAGHLKLDTSTNGYALFHGVTGRRGSNVISGSREVRAHRGALAALKSIPRALKDAAR